MTTITDVAAPVLRAGLSFLSRRRLPQTSGIIKLEGLSQPAEVLRDRWGVPHIYSKNMTDSLFSLGFVHAQDRLFQMELNRRTATGRLSELFGPMALDTDRAARTFGWSRLGMKDYQDLHIETKESMDAYVAGVNAYINHPSSKLPIEFTLLGIKPEPWRIEDSMAFSRLMFWQLSHAWYSEIVRAQLISKVGPEHAAEWEIKYPSENPAILPKGIEFNRLDANGSLKGISSPQMQRSQGSNCWVVSGERSVTGKPYLCNDMHLVLTLPTIWYEAHLSGGPLNISGVTMPAMPFILAGHNDRISWGITLAFTDCEDLFIEKFDPDQPHSYQTPDGWKQAEVVNETIKVKGASDHLEPVLYTRHGPVISDVVGYPEQKVAVCSMSLRPTTGLQAFYTLNQAKNWDDFKSAMNLINSTQLNVGYADVDGNIGYYVTGTHPIRGKGDGRVPTPGWDADYDWKGEIPFAELPHALNPEKGYIVTCNNKIIPDDYPYNLGEVWMNGYRAKRLSQMIEETPKLSPQDFNRMHMDDYCIPAGEFIKRFESFTSSDPQIQTMLGRLRSWDQRLSTDSVPGTIYEVVRYTLVRNLMEPVLGKEMTTHLLGIAFNPILLNDHEYFGYDTVSLLRMLDDPNSWWISQAGGRDKLIQTTFKQAYDWLSKELGENVDEWHWGKLHKLTFAHTLGVQKPLDKVFNRGPYSIAGDTDTPLQSAMSPDSPYDNKLWSPSVRFIMDMSDLSKSQVVTPVGQSGQLGSPHYDDFINMYMNGQYHPMLWTREQVDANLESTLIISPM